jgi:membrane protease YdiL (CAAX protease family)
MLAWCGLWMCKVGADARSDWFGGESFTAVFWLVSKLVVWILLAVLLIRASGRDIASVINWKEWRRWCLWGTMIGLLIAATGFLPKVFAGQPLLPSKLDYGTLNVLVIAPLFEEFLIRAAVLGNLIPAIGFARANVLASVYFVVLHIPGWYMMGSLAQNLSQPVGGALSIFLLGLLFGWITQKGRSFLGGSIAHCLNNLAS